jgi:ABC-type Fe3+-hydroxamate transport system substrate-binding protein
MTIETFYKEIFLKKYLDEFVEENIKKENDENYIQKLKTKAENFIEYYKNEENENKNYLSKKRKNKSIFVINYYNKNLLGEELSK